MISETNKKFSANMQACMQKTLFAHHQHGIQSFKFAMLCRVTLVHIQIPQGIRFPTPLSKAKDYSN
jgi:hypothetical protein